MFSFKIAPRATLMIQTERNVKSVPKLAKKIILKRWEQQLWNNLYLCVPIARGLAESTFVTKAKGSRNNFEGMKFPSVIEYYKALIQWNNKLKLITFYLKA